MLKKLFTFMKNNITIMNIEEVRSYCIKKRCVTESFPFDETTLVFKVCNKMFALLSLEENFSLNIKCEPNNALKLREEFSEITPGYHMNKQHWNTIDLKGSLKNDLIKQLIDDSYNLIVDGLPKKIKKDLN